MKSPRKAILTLATAPFLACATLQAVPAAAEEAVVPEPLVGFFERHCVVCHDSLESKGEVNLDVVWDSPEGFLNDGHLLELLHRTLAEEEMPPADEEQPTDKERESMVEALDSLYATLAEKHRDEPGFVVMQRLTKQEYRNVFRDLTDGVVTEAGKYLPNEGGAGEGFNNVGEAQGMGTAQVEKFLEAARMALRHLRATPHDGLVWRSYPREAVDEPADARLDEVNRILSWFADQQYLWARDFPAELEEKYGTAHGAYLEAAWRYRHREDEDTTLADVAAAFDPPLPLAPLEKWWKILSADEPEDPWTPWAEAWQKLPGPDRLGDRDIRTRCNDIVLGRDSEEERQSDYDTFAPDYELSFRPDGRRGKTIESALKSDAWPFRIEIGDAEELFLVTTDAGDGNRGDYVIWHSGVFEYEDGSRKPWHRVTKIRGANSGKIYPWAKYNDGSGKLRADGFGAKPPGALKIEVPEGATHLTVRAEIDKDKTDRASVQALVLREKPPHKKQSLYPDRLVFGGKKGATNSDDKLADERRKRIRRINIPGANRTKAGLNAERNVFADWDRTPVEFIGGPWDYQEADENNPDSPYHLTAEQVLRSARPEDLATLDTLKDRLASISQVEHQRLARLALEAGWEKAREGVAPPEGIDLPDEAKALREKIAATESDLATEAVETVTTFAEGAWRRPIAEGERDLFFRLFREARGDGISYDGSIKQPLLAILTSPHFLYRVPVDPDSGKLTESEADGERDLTGFELANRLSFFLWASLPDEELLALGASGELRDPEVLRAQVRRMLADDRARSLATEFAGQVFGFVGFEDHNVPDPERFPEFTPDIREAMIEEVVRFSDHIFGGHAPLTDLVTADYSFVNRDLARHYGIDGVESNRFERVSMPPQRGGLTGMGVFLTKTSEPLRTSPVVRGTWIFESILGRELPSPPAGIPAISQDETDEQGRSIREQLEAHSNMAGCASCHEKIDPFGIALEHFDPIGRWRETLNDGSDPDTATKTKDGVPLNGAGDLRTYLGDRGDAILGHVTKKLLGYALGRGVSPGDKALLDRLAADLPKHDHRFPWLVEEIVTSPQFRRRSASFLVSDASSSE